MTISHPIDVSEAGLPEHDSAVAPEETDAHDVLRRHRESMQRYQDRNRTLPYATKVTCPRCGDIVTGVFDSADMGEVVLRYNCDDCGVLEETHGDTIWSKPLPDRLGSAENTYAGHAVKPNARLLPRTVETLCPECAAVIVGRYFVENGSVLIEKHCPEHGHVRDIVNRDVRLYLKSAYWSFEEQAGLLNPSSDGELGCPSDCGLCGRHQSCSCLANIDLTNRCNLNCPICFANANAAGYVYEPGFDEIVAMLQALRDIRPTPATAVQFSGGEPTMHPRFFDIVSRTTEMGFSNIQIATNGLKMADIGFAQRAVEAGLHTLYLQFDGVGPDAYLQTRGCDIWEKKLAVVENCRRLGLKICLVPTIIKTVNDHEVGEIFHFAAANVDVISGISYQPVCFTGRIDTEERLRQRYTLGDLAHDLADATGAVLERDFYPLSIVMPLSQLLEAVTGDPKIKPSCHTDCAFGTYYLVDDDHNVYPFPAALDVEAMFTGMSSLSRQFAGRAGRLSPIDKMRIFRLFKSVFREGQMPPGLTVKGLIKALQGMVDKSKGRGKTGSGNYRTLMAAGMHFQDRYNYDIERIKRCVIPYSTPIGLVPFCAYNSGPTYRPLIEKLYAK